MILKEVAFDRPLVNETGKIEAFMQKMSIREEVSIESYYNQMWKDKRITFMNETEMICSKIKSMLPKIKTYSTWKLMINCMEKEEYVPQCFNGDICEVSVVFDFEKYYNSNDEGKVYLQLCALEDAVNCTILNGIIDYKPILDICNELKTESFDKNIYVWKKKRITKEYTASIVLEHTLKHMNIYAEFNNRDGESVYKKLLVQEHPSPLCYHLHLGHIEVEEERGIILYNKLKTKAYKASMPVNVKAD